MLIMITPEQLYERLKNEKVTVICNEVWEDLNRLPPDGAKVNKRNTLASIISACSAIMKIDKKEDITFEELSKNSFKDYKSTIEALTEAVNDYGICAG